MAILDFVEEAEKGQYAYWKYLEIIRVGVYGYTVDPVINDPVINDLLSPTTFFSCTEHFSIVNNL